MSRVRDVPGFAVVFALLIAIAVVGDALDGESRMALVFLPLVYAATALGFRELGSSRRVLAGNAAAMAAGYGLAIASAVTGVEALAMPGLVLAALYAVVGAIMMLRHVLTVSRVTANVVFAALGVYLLLGVIFAIGYTQAALADPTVFTPAQDPTGDSSLYYFSFTTLTTIGFGDIVPAAGWLRAATMVEGLLGQIFLVVLVARLVGLQVAQSARRRPSDRDRARE